MQSDVTRTDPSDLVRGESVAALGESRARVLATLQDAAHPLTVGEVADLVGLHANTARFHLDALADNGLVDRAVEERVVPGRPRMLYSARPGGARPGRRSYQLLAEILASFVAAQTPHAAKAALEAGRSWGRYLTERPEPFRKVDAAAATDQLVATLDEIGFEPEAVSAGGRRQILLHQCPFRETAERHQELVCSIHLGLMRGVLQELDAPLEAERLEPFVEPSLCVARLGSRDRSGAAGKGSAASRSTARSTARSTRGSTGGKRRS